MTNGRCDYKIRQVGMAVASECSKDTRLWQWKGIHYRICSNCFAAEMASRQALIDKGPGRGYTLAESDAMNYDGGMAVGMWKKDSGYHPLLGPDPVFAWEALSE